MNLVLKSHTVEASRPFSQWEQLPPFDIPAYRKSHAINTSQGLPTDSYLKTKDSDYLKEHTLIKTLEQRRQYKKDFYLEYNSYLGLNEFIKTFNYTTTVQELNNILQNEKNGY